MFIKRKTHAFSNRYSSKTNRGSLVLGLVLIWVPVLLVFGVVLWIKANALNFLKSQRSLDRCVFSVIENRCQTLQKLASLNKHLSDLEFDLYLLIKSQAGKAPVVGVAARVAEVGLYGLIYEQIAHQEVLMAQEKIQSLAIFKCGIPLKGSLPLLFSRPETTVSSTIQAPAPLVWKNPVQSSEFSVMRVKKGEYHSYAHCEGSGKLNGETYLVQFTKVRNLEVQSSNVFSSLPWP